MCLAGAALTAAAWCTPAPTPVFVLNSLDASVSVIDPIQWKEVKRLPTGKEPHHLYMTPDEKSIVVANSLADSLTFIDPRTAEIQRTMRGILDPYQLRFSPDMKWFVVAGNRLNHVDVYRWDGQNLQLARRLSTPRTPSHIWIDRGSTTAFVSLQDSDELIAIDLASQTERWRIKTGPLPADVYGTPDGKALLVGLTGGDSVEVFDISGPVPRVQKWIRTGAGTHAFRSAGDGRFVFVSNRVANTVSKIDLQLLTSVETYPAPGGPDCIEVLPGARMLLVSSRWAQKLTLIDTKERKVVGQVAVGKAPHGVWTLNHAPR